MNHVRTRRSRCSGLLPVADEADLPRGIRHAMRTDRGVSDDGVVGTDPACPVIALAGLGFQGHVLRSGLSEIDQEARCTCVGIMKSVVAFRHERGVAQRLPVFVHQYRACVKMRLQACARPGGMRRCGKCAKLDEISTLHGQALSNSHGTDAHSRMIKSYRKNVSGLKNFRERGILGRLSPRAPAGIRFDRRTALPSSCESAQLRSRSAPRRPRSLPIPTQRRAGDARRARARWAAHCRRANRRQA